MRVRDLVTHSPCVVRYRTHRGYRTDRSLLNEEMKSKFQWYINSLREVKLEPSAYNLLVNTPEFSRFVFVVPGLAVLGTTALAASPPTTLPLIFEKLIPYHIKTIAISAAFHSFIDLAINVLGRPFPTSHHRVKIYSGLVLAYASLLTSAGVVSISDYNPHDGYKATLALLGIHTIPALTLPMAPWVRVWRLGFLALSGVSVVTAWSKLRYLESHWDDVIFAS